jgi:hypothetical protein
MNSVIEAFDRNLSFPALSYGCGYSLPSQGSPFLTVRCGTIPPATLSNFSTGSDSSFPRGIVDFSSAAFFVFVSLIGSPDISAQRVKDLAGAVSS